MYYVYILSNHNNSLLYIGITNDLERRLAEHKSHAFPGFTRDYRVDKLVYYEDAAEPYDAIAREKQLKGWTRAKKNSLIQSRNPLWKDLSADWYAGP